MPDLSPSRAGEERRTGRELDAMIATEVFGFWDVVEFEGQLVHGEHNINGWPMPTPHYSTDIAEAWLVVEKMRALGWRFSATAERRTYACFRMYVPHDVQGDWMADDMPSTICNAALEALAALHALEAKP